MLLQELMAEAGIKNLTLSEVLQYDVSYISKWVTGRLLPSEKSIDQITRAISACVVKGLSEKKKEKMLMLNESADEEELQDKLYEKLLQAYYESKGEELKKSGKNGKQVLKMHMPMRRLIEDVRFFHDDRKGSIKIAAVIDLFSLDRESRLLFAGIEKGHFLMEEKYPNVEFTMIFNANPVVREEKADSVYDSIFLIHMLTSFSHVNFGLYDQLSAYGKFLFAAKDRFCLSGMLQEDDRECLAVQWNEDLEAVNELYQRITMFCCQETLEFRKSSIWEMLLNHEYMQLMISTDIKWLLGHITELLLPDELFSQLVEQLPEEWHGKKEELERVHNFSSHILQTGPIQIMIYESAFTDFVISGELDFYNHKVLLTVEQRLMVLEYYLMIFQGEKKGSIKLIEGGFSTDFQYITNPCMFLSSSICYLRLENGCYNDNILVLNDKQIRDMFGKFYHTIWNHRQDMVLESEEEVCSRIRQYIQSARLLEDVK